MIAHGAAAAWPPLPARISLLLLLLPLLLPLLLLLLLPLLPAAGFSCAGRAAPEASSGAIQLGEKEGGGL